MRASDQSSQSDDDTQLGVPRIRGRPTIPTPEGRSPEYGLDGPEPAALPRGHAAGRLGWRPAVEARYPAEIRQAVARRCSRALRDGVIPELAALRERLGATLEEETAASLADLVDDGLSIVAGEIEGLRHLINELHPVAIDRQGLFGALWALAEQTTVRTGTETLFEAAQSDVEPRVTREVAIGVYRIVEEAIRNCSEHAQATRIVLQVRATDHLSIEVTDNGVGFKPAATAAGFGLATMRERAQLIDAVVRVESAPSLGCRVTIKVPMRCADRLAPPHEGLDAQMAERRIRLRRGVNAQEAECARWAREIHDEPLQHLAVVLARAWPSTSGDGETSLQEAAESMRTGLGAALLGLSELIDDVSLVPTGSVGLIASLEMLAGRARSDTRDVALDISPEMGLPAWDDEAVAIYRIAQEALTNAVKHSCASLVTLSARQTSRGLILTVSDNGIGFDTASKCSGFGLTCMNERAELLGASLRISSRAGRGTSVRLSIPAARLHGPGQETCA